MINSCLYYVSPYKYQVSCSNLDNHFLFPLIKKKACIENKFSSTHTSNMIFCTIIKLLIQIKGLWILWWFLTVYPVSTKPWEGWYGQHVNVKKGLDIREKILKLPGKECLSSILGFDKPLRGCFWHITLILVSDSLEFSLVLSCCCRYVPSYLKNEYTWCVNEKCHVCIKCAVHLNFQGHMYVNWTHKI